MSRHLMISQICTAFLYQKYPITELLTAIDRRHNLSRLNSAQTAADKHKLAMALFSHTDFKTRHEV